jgi:polysaccharide biosynthesis protein PslJ
LSARPIDYGPVASYGVRERAGALTVGWSALLSLTILVILFIPIKRYRLPGDLPFQLEPYRIVIAMVAAAWVASLLVDPSVRLRRSGFEAPLLLFVLAALGSLVTNGERIGTLGLDGDVAKDLTFFASFIIILYLVASVGGSAAKIESLVRLLVLGGAVVGVLAVVESRTNFDPFEHLHRVLPFLIPDFLPTLPEIGRHKLRAFGSAQHPIALGALLAMLLPLAVSLAKTGAGRRWWLAAAALTAGSLASVSRTGVLMLAVVACVLLLLRFGQSISILPALLPVLIVVQLAVPGTLGTIRASFFPKEGLQNEQSTAGRIEDYGPSIAEFVRKPVLGEGFGTREVVGEKANARFLDNQWLGTLIETGLVGALALLWLFARALRLFGGAARRDCSRRGWLLAAITASVASYAVGMFFFDTFAFIQVTFVLFILLGFGAALLLADEEAPPPAELQTAQTGP